MNRSWGARGHPFAQHYSCPAVLRCSIGSTKWRLWGTIFVCEKSIASIAQGCRKRHPCAQSARRQHPCCRLKSFAHRARRRALSLWRRQKSRKQDLRHNFPKNAPTRNPKKNADCFADRFPSTRTRRRPASRIAASPMKKTQGSARGGQKNLHSVTKIQRHTLQSTHYFLPFINLYCLF